jgi:hypothetical protein
VARGQPTLRAQRAALRRRLGPAGAGVPALLHLHRRYDGRPTAPCRTTA